MLRRLIAVLALATVALPACAASGADAVGVTTTTAAKIDRQRLAACEHQSSLPCVYDSDCCAGVWCIKGNCE
jgi:curli biogenesis system outer membrane secretion channel CsgG